MNFSEGFRIALNSLIINRLRAVLTTLGIVIGVGAVVGFAWQIPAGLADPLWLPALIVAVVAAQWWFARRMVARGVLR